MIIERSLHPDWLSNTYLVGDEPGGKAVAIDAGGPSGPLMEKAESEGLEVTHLLLTHHHHDHVVEAQAWKDRFGARVLAHPLEAERVETCDGTIEAGEELDVGGLSIVGLPTPGHTDGMLNFRVNDDDVFTGDTLFKGSVGGVKAPHSTSYADIKTSIMDVLMKLPPETRLHPGPHRPDDGRRGVGGRTRSSASGAGSTPRARSPAPCGSATRRSSYGRPTTTAATRPGSAGRTQARTTSCRAPRSSVRVTAADGPLARAGLRVQHRGAHVLLGLGRLRGQPAASDGSPRGWTELVLAVVQAVGADGGRVAAGLARGDRLELRRDRHGCRAPSPGASRPRGARPRAWRSVASLRSSALFVTALAATSPTSGPVCASAATGMGAAIALAHSASATLRRMDLSTSSVGC